MEQGAEARPVRRKAKFEAGFWMPLAPELDPARDGGGQAEIRWDSRAQAAEHGPDLPLHVGDGFQG